MSAHSEAAGGLVIGESMMNVLSSLPQDSIEVILGDVFCRFIGHDNPNSLDPAEKAIANLVLAKAQEVNGSLRKRQEQSKNARTVGRASHEIARPSHDNLTTPTEERKESEGSPTPLPNKESKEDNIITQVKPVTKRFVKPTVDEVRAYCAERNNGINAEDFVDFYESKGWKVGKNPMVDWKACVRTWERSRGNASNRRCDAGSYGFSGARLGTRQVSGNFRAGTEAQRAEASSVL